MKKSKTNVFRGFAALLAVLCAFTCGGTAMAVANPSLVNDALHVKTSMIVNTEGDETNSQYFSCDYKTAAELLEAKKSLISQIGSEGCVLLYNKEGALPLTENEVNISLFGRGSVDFAYDTSGGGGSLNRGDFGLPSSREPDNFACLTLEEVLTNNGKKVNPVLVEFYKASELRRAAAGRRNPTAIIGEVPLSEYTGEVRASYEDYKDAAIVVLGRRAGEGADIPTTPEGLGDGDGIHNYLQVQDYEVDLAKEAKEAGFKKVIVVLNSDYVLGNTSALKEYADAIITMPGAGYTGIQGLADVLTGKISPSGHLEEVFAANPASAPAVINAGNFAWTNQDEIVDKTKVVAAQSGYYVVYAEGIYTGYRYYETRYEDTILGRGNATGKNGATSGTAWNYADEVEYSFGYGLSYTTFKEELIDVDREHEQATVKVTNTGDKAGKHVVQLYVQTPYTQYDMENKVEKSAISLVAFEKTKELAPGESETLEIEYDSHLYASYDYTNAKSYFMDAGDYYFALGNGAHDALNNVLAKKGYTAAGGMDYDGDPSKVFAWTEADADFVTYTTSEYTGAEITNRFDDADLNYYMPGTVTYLSRNDWEGTWPKAYSGLTANAAVIAGLSKFRYENGTTDSIAQFLAFYGDNGKVPAFGVAEKDLAEGEKPAIAAATMIGVSWDDPLWEDFLDQLTYKDLAYFFGDGKHHSYTCVNVAYPGSYQLDGPSGNNATYAKAEDETIQKYNSRMFGTQTLLACTFNKDLAWEQGKMIGNDGFYNGCHAAWGCGLDYKRTPYAGRNTEYLSEDAVHDYYMGASLTSGAASKGFALCPKHFAFNDQETNRQGLATFMNEQQARENDLRAFEGAFAIGEAKGTMTTFARIGTTYGSAEYDLMTGMLVEEWGSHAFSITDTLGGSTDKASGFMEGPESCLAGTAFMDSNVADGFCGPYTSELTGPLAGTEYAQSDAILYGTVSAEIISKDPLLAYACRVASKKTLYEFINGAAMNGVSADTRVVTIEPWWKTALFALDAALGALALLMFVLYVRSLSKDKSQKEA